MGWAERDLERKGSLDLEALEFGVRDRMRQVGARVLEEVLNSGGKGYEGSSVSCRCGGRARFVDYRSKEVNTVMGSMTIQRAYYHCGGCGEGRFPQDEVFDVKRTSYSPGVRRLCCYVGMKEPFAGGSESLKELAGLRVEAKDVERMAEGVGRDIRSREEKECESFFSGLVETLPLKRCPEKVYVAMDGTGVPVVPKETEGRAGKGEDGKAHTREAKLGCVFTQTTLNAEGKPLRDEASTTYVGIIETSEVFGREVYAEVAKRGLEGARIIVVLGDGAPWIWVVAEEHFPMAIQILDLYHARQHLWKVGRVAFAKDEEELKRWMNKRIAELDLGDIPALVNAFQELPVHDERSVETIRTEIDFFEKNQQRMRYAYFRSLGLFVGSGVIEAGCKSVIAQRLKQSGMQWTVAGANSIITLRRTFISGSWEDYWQDRCSA